MFSALQNHDMRLDAKMHKDTGLLLYSRHSINLKRVSRLEQHHVESIWIEVSIKRSKPILMGFIYRNPSEHVDCFFKFNSMMREVNIQGDFNVDLLKPNARWNQLYESYNLH